MNKYIYILLVSLITVSCDELTVAPGSGPLVTDKDKVSNVENKPFSDPAIIYGSNFGQFFQEMYKLGDYDGMMAFTSSESIELHGKDVILEHYKNMTFGFDLGKLKSIQEDEDEDGRMSMFYLSDIDATKVRFILHVKIENDSCKVLIHKNIEHFPLNF